MDAESAEAMEIEMVSESANVTVFEMALKSVDTKDIALVAYWAWLTEIRRVE